jgi:carboxylesterase type B
VCVCVSMCVCVCVCVCVCEYACARRSNAFLLHSLVSSQVLALLASPGSRGLFSAAMSLSGSPNMSMPLHVMEQQGLQLVAGVGCTGAPDILACMRSKTWQELRAATPQHWAYEGDFDADTVTPHPAPYPGLVIADGVTVQPLQQALARGLVDVPVVFATVLCEGDSGDAQREKWNESDFATFVTQQFRNWPAQVATTINKEYAALAQTRGDFAYYNLNSDACVSCGNAQLAVTAAKGFSSPVYLAINTHWPAKKLYPGSLSDAPKEYPFHTWDTTCAFRTWSRAGLQEDGKLYQPEPSDETYGATLRALWFSLASTGKLPANAKTVDATINFPQSYNTVLLDTIATTVTDFKTDTCNRLYDLGLDERFWWVN